LFKTYFKKLWVQRYNIYIKNKGHQLLL